MLNLSEKTKHLKQSGIRAATMECGRLNGINLGQGVCDIPMQDVIKNAATTAIQSNKNLYSPCEGIPELRAAVAEKIKQFNKINVTPDEVMISHGSTGAFVCAVLTLFNQGDEVILFEPFYGYHKNVLELHGMQSKTVPINLTDFSIDFDRLRAAIGPKTRGIVICTPCNPCGKVFTESELLAIGKLAEEHNLYIITDEIYEYIVYPGYKHVSLASLANFKDRTVTISGFSKTYNMTGWRLGYASAPAAIIEKMALVQDYVYVCPATPLQYAVLAAFTLDDDYYQNLAQTYLINRNIVVDTLETLGFKFYVPQGAYYMLVDFSHLKFTDDQAAMTFLLQNAKVATVTGRSFYLNPADGKHILRICYALDERKISQAMDQLKAVKF